MIAQPLRLVILALCVQATHSTFGQTFVLQDVDSGLPSPQGNYRWVDVADQPYSAAYRTSYNYRQATVTVTFDASSQPVRGVLLATNLKPNFAYQLKLVGTDGMPDNEKIGRAGRYWQESWSGSAWASGQNLNNKGSGTYPSPNDTAYLATRDVPNAASPTGRQYKYTCYLVFDYLITDDQGNATVSFQLHSSYHVLWKTSQRTRGAQDGPAKSATFDPSPTQRAYGTDYPSQTVTIFGEWERLPAGGIQLMPGDYPCQVFLTEESFHGSGGQYAGGWAAAMAADVTFRVAPRIRAISSAKDVISLAVADCYIGFTNRIERAADLGPAASWQKVFVFVSATPDTNWSETIGTGAARAFYRVVSGVTP